MRYEYKTQPGVCCQAITFDLNGDTVNNIVYNGGCPGNVKAIAKLAEGMTVQMIVDRLRGNPCGPKPSSCGDQLAVAVQMAYDKEAAEHAAGQPA